MASHDLTRPGLVLIGDAAGFTLNTGLSIRGMDMATGSAIAAATAIGQALEAGDFSQQSMDGYVRELRASFVGRDMHTYRHAPGALSSPRLYHGYGTLAADLFHALYRQDTTPRKHALNLAVGAMKKSGMSLFSIAKDVWSLSRAL